MPEPLINLLAAVWTDTLVLAADLTEDEWNRSTDCPGWSVKDHVAHMIGTENMLEGEQPPPADIGDAAHVRNDIGTFNEQWVAVYRDRPGKEALDDFRVITDRRLATLRALPAEEWEKEGFTPEGPGPYRQFMEIRVFDCWFHDQDMREALNRQGFLEGPAADLSLGRIPPKGLPYVVGKKAGAPQGSSVVFDVTGAPPIVAAISVEGRAALLDAPPADPTTTLTMDRRTFGRLAGGRWNGDRARVAGTVQVGGDVELGNRVLDNMAFTI
ncbi:MAG: maleylpyruvate isomerase family mycothiol-dependent enzyme [Actinomycetota bacterium]|nr:maleylpyruvate isomerase family mycothiol-dependent enzyme [Actinomycetota bacterium]